MPPSCLPVCVTYCMCKPACLPMCIPERESCRKRSPGYPGRKRESCREESLPDTLGERGNHAGKRGLPGMLGGGIPYHTARVPMVAILSRCIYPGTPSRVRRSDLRPSRLHCGPRRESGLTALRREVAERTVGERRVSVLPSVPLPTPVSLLDSSCCPGPKPKVIQ